MKPNCIFILLSAFLWFAAAGLKAQVTIGLDREPAQAALLQIMSQAPDGENVTSAQGGGGLVLPRVKLVSLTTLQPFIATADDDQKKVHVGLQVYNLTDDTNFDPGIYVWVWDVSTSTYRWKAVTPASATVTANNGLTKTGDNIRLGGPLTQKTTISGTSLTDTLAVTARTHITGNLRYGASATNGHVLTTDASGNATWKAAPVASANNGLTLAGSAVQLGGALTKKTAISYTSLTDTLAVTARTHITGNLRYGASATNGHVLTTDASGNATWKAAPVTAANNGLTLAGGAVQLGGALTKKTAISYTNLTDTLAVTARTHITGNLRYGASATNGHVLTTDASGNATWKALPAASAVTANNGLKKTGDNIQLGGNLTEATTVTLGANNLLLNATEAGKIAIGDTSSLNASAILEVNSTNKGVLLPRVALTSNTDVTTTGTPVRGLIVYNTTSNSTLNAGLVAWEGNSWRSLVMEIPNSSSTGGLQRRLNLVSNVNLGANTTLPLNFGTVTIPETGSYAFAIRLIGSVTGISSGGSRTYTVSLNGGGGDSQQITHVLPTSSSINVSATIILTGTFTAGATATFSINGPYWSITTTSSMVWWKL